MNDYNYFDFDFDFDFKIFKIPSFITFIAFKKFKIFDLIDFAEIVIKNDDFEIIDNFNYYLKWDYWRRVFWSDFYY
jgi:hypothetical protein